MTKEKKHSPLLDEIHCAFIPEESLQDDGGEHFIYTYTCIESEFAPPFQKYRSHKKEMKAVLLKLLSILENG